MVLAVDDAHLVAAARWGDLEAFEILVQRHRVRAYRIALRMLGDREDAEDAVQEAFLLAWQRLERFRGESAFVTWLYRIVVNVCLTERSKRRPAVALDEVGEPAAAATVEEQVSTRERLDEVIQAIGELSGEQRAALVLRELEGLSYEEIAEVLSTTVGAVKGRIHRARVELVERLRRQW